MEIEVTPHVNVIILPASAPDSYNQPQLTDRNALSGTVWKRLFSCGTVGDGCTAEAEALKTKRHFVHCVYPLHRKSLWAIMIAILCVIIHFLIVLLKSSTSLELPLRADMRVSEAINFNRRMRTPFIKPSDISARNPLNQLSNSKHFIKLCAAANLRELRCNSAGNWLHFSFTFCLAKVFVFEFVQVSADMRSETLPQSLAAFKVSPALLYLLGQLAVGRCNEASGVVNVAPHHVVGEV